MVEIVSPTTTAQVADTLKHADLAVLPQGAGTKQGWAGPPSTVDILLDLRRLTGVTSHTPGDLVATAAAGTPLQTLQAKLATANQRLALDPPSAAAGATLGGVLATGEAGPLRHRYGTGRDLLIGAEFVRADGTVAHSGGRVVKNVAGYDIGKLLCGSHGTLAVLTSVTLRLHPLPAARVWVSRPVATAQQAQDLVTRLLSAQLVPSAVELDLPDGRAGTVAVLLEGTEAGTAQRADSLVRLFGVGSSIVESPPSWWGSYPFDPGDVALRLQAPITDLGEVMAQLAAPARGSAGAGVLHAAVPPDRAASVLAAVRKVCGAVVLTAPPELLDDLDRWGPVPGLGLMRRIKEQFDPQRRLAPGRFVGGI